MPSDSNVDFYHEQEPRGNTGALACVQSGESDVLFTFGDLVTTVDFSALVALHREQGNSITLGSHYEDHRLTLGELIVEGDRVVKYQEKPTKRFLICSGLPSCAARH